MANAIPLIEGTDASGGYLVRDSYGETLQNTILRVGATQALCRVDRVPGKRQRYTVYAGRPTAAFVAEGAAKPATGAEFSEVVVNIKKIATVVLYTDELLEDAVEDPRVLVNADVEGAFADLIDAHLLGYAAGAQITTQFDSALRATSQTVEYGGTADALAVATSDAMALIEANGGTATGAVWGNGARAVLRNARGAGDNITTPVFTAGFDREPDSLYGVRLGYSSNLPAITPPAAGRVVGIVGDFTHAVIAMRQDIVIRTTDQATVDVGGTLHHLWQQNKTAVQWEMRLGFVAHDLNRMFVAVLNAA